MMRFYLPIILTVLATTLYHVAQKSIPSQVNPMLSLTVNYATALAISLAVLPFYPSQTALASSWRQVNWGSYAVGSAIFGVELSVLLAYRVGWRISISFRGCQCAYGAAFGGRGPAFLPRTPEQPQLAGSRALPWLVLVVQR